MYLQYFGLAQYPFSLTPNTRYFLRLPSHTEAFKLLIASLQGEGCFAKITGEVGTGKTMLCRKVLNALELHKGCYTTAYIPHPILSEEGIMYAITEELSIDREANISYYDLLKRITEDLIILAEENKCTVLFIDEAQAMPEETLKAVHLLTQIETVNDKPLRIILFGQPELDELLKHPILKQLEDNMSFAFQIPALDRDGLESYVAHRLNKAGYSGPHMLTPQALDALYEGSQGVPRLINVLCHKALMVAFGKGDQSIDKSHIESAIADTEVAKREKGLVQRLFGK